MSDEMTKCERCKHEYFDFENEKSVCGLDLPQFSTETDADCNQFDSRYIEYPLTIEGIDNKFEDSYQMKSRCGTLVKIAPCADEYKGKTYLGILLGYFPIDNFITFGQETKILSISPHYNPAIFIPETKTVVYGCGSWWGVVNSEEELKAITKEDIENVWYVKMLKGLSEKS
jgi:hypothetical protein